MSAAPRVSAVGVTVPDGGGWVVSCDSCGMFPRLFRDRGPASEMAVLHEGTHRLEARRELVARLEGEARTAVHLMAVAAMVADSSPAHRDLAVYESVLSWQAAGRVRVEDLIGELAGLARGGS